MMTQEQIVNIVFEAIDEFNLSQEEGSQLDKQLDEVLFTRAGFTDSGKLDSLSMVYFLVTLEEHLQKQLGAQFNLKTQELIDTKEDNLQDVSSLVGFILKAIH